MTLAGFSATLLFPTGRVSLFSPLHPSQPHHMYHFLFQPHIWGYWEIMSVCRFSSLFLFALSYLFSVQQSYPHSWTLSCSLTLSNSHFWITEEQDVPLYWREENWYYSKLSPLQSFRLIETFFLRKTLWQARDEILLCTGRSLFRGLPLLINYLILWKNSIFLYSGTLGSLLRISFSLFVIPGVNFSM